MKGIFYLVYNTESDKVARPSMYKALGNARSYRTKCHNKRKRVYTVKIYQDYIDLLSKINYDFKQNLDRGHYEGGHELDEKWMRSRIAENEKEIIKDRAVLAELKAGNVAQYTDVFVIYEVDLATGAKKIVVDGKGKVK